jgi:signal transduction histidine kinase
MRQQKLPLKAAGIAAAVIAVSVVHVLAHGGPHDYRAFYGELYFVPLVLSGLWFGLRGALATSLSITAFFLPFTWATWSDVPPYGLDNLLEVLLLNGVALGLGVFRDRERTALEQLREAQTLAAMGEAVSAAAHDMRAPLTAIGGFANLVLKGLSAEDPAREKLEIVVQETRRLEALTDNMLDFSRPLDLAPEPTDLNRLVEESLTVVRAGLGGSGVRVESQLSSGLPAVAVDRGRMVQVLINLTGNAVEASPPGTAVSVGTAQKGSDLLVEVVDAGPGISAEEREAIFRPFFTTKKKGTGLGLPIAKKIVEAHGGSLEMVDNPSQGVTARIALPAG